MTDHVKMRSRLRELDKCDFIALMDKCIITDEENEIMKRHYLKGQTFAFIADTLGYSESAVKYKHKSVIKRISRYL